MDLFDQHYYVKKEAIVAKIPFGNRTFYAKFARIDEPLTPLLLKQHLDKQYTIAAPLLKNNKTNYLVIEYKGEAHQRFFYLIQHLLKTQHIDTCQIYQGKYSDKIQVFIRVEGYALKEAEEQLEALSALLEQKLEKQWKCLPSSSLPPDYNIVTLPYTRLA